MSSAKEKILDELQELDPSDSMSAAMDLITRALDAIEPPSKVDEAILEMIYSKEKEAMDYYLRPLDDDSIYNRLIALNEGVGNKDRVERYKRALDVRQARRWALLADSQAVVGNNSKASRFYKRSLFFGPTEDVIDEVRSAAARSEKRIEKARKEIDRSMGRLRSDPGSRRIALECIKYLMDLDRQDEANEILEEYLKDSEEDFDLLFMKGCILFSRGEHEGSSVIFERLTRMNPDSLKARRCHNWSVQMMDMGEAAQD
ncbi:MAG: hypothetical protein QCI82_09000 [Candidatus Thermoplasmatota archaeon]|nr:hypothetical protein [Candidatus Thermoplasmatota archaeon]